VSALLLIAHGSRLASSNDEIRTLTGNLRQISSPFQLVECAFLEIAQPSICEGLRNLIANGAPTILVLPYFLSAGRHVTNDIPAEIAKIQLESPGVEIKIAPYFGATPLIEQILMQQAIAGYVKNSSN
jgi:sirohydrochlorin ferrochelatase